MTHFLRDILRQPDELRRTIDYLYGEGRSALEAAAAAIRGSRHVYLTGIGSSWHAAVGAGPLFYQRAHPVYMQDAAELLQFGPLPRGAVMVVISRSGRSVEIVKLLAKARESEATVIGITSSQNGQLAQQAQVCLLVPIQADYAISVNSYSALAAAAGALASATGGSVDGELASALSRTLTETARLIPAWQEQLASTAWLVPGATYYFLARGSSLGSCYEARLLWEEGAKSPATAMGTGGFRHGPQEMAMKGARFGLWIDGQRMREQDWAVARDLRQLGGSVLLIGQDLPLQAADLLFQLPTVPAEWQFLIDVIPAQLAAERLAQLSGVNCDSFRYCSYIVENEYGLLHKETRTPRDEMGKTER